MQGKQRLLKLLFMVVHTMLVVEEPKLILAGNVTANGDGGDIKSNGNLLFSGLDSSELLYILMRSYSISKFPILIRSFNALMTLALLVWPNLQCQILTCLFLLIRCVGRP